MVHQSAQTAASIYYTAWYIISEDSILQFQLNLGSIVMRSEVVMSMTVNISGFWDMTPGSVVDVHKHFRGTCYFYLHLP
jgi:hypothetical protein